MKRNWLAFMIIGIAVLLAWSSGLFTESDQDGPEPNASSSSPQQEEFPPELLSPSQSPSRSPQPSLQARSREVVSSPVDRASSPNRPRSRKGESGRPSSPPPGAVPYRLEGRWLVAYGDVLLGQPTATDVPVSGFAEAGQLQLWETREIPFLISPKLVNPDRVKRALVYLNEHSPLRFVEMKAGDPDVIVFEPTEKYCRSYLGRVGGHQPVYLSQDCQQSEVLHEIMHALGFVHEQSRTDRDGFIKIHWERIQEDKKDQFEVVPDEYMETAWGRPFDYKSVMMYSPFAFARRPGEAAMESLTRDLIDPVREGLSSEDLNRLHQVYGHLR